MIITDKWLKSVTTKSSHHLNREQVLLLGLRFPLKSGWKWDLIGTEISEERAKCVAEADAPGDKVRKMENFRTGRYHDEAIFGKEFATFYTRPHLGSWCWSYKHPSEWKKNFTTNKRGEVET